MKTFQEFISEVHRPPHGWKPYGGYEKEPVKVNATADRIDAIRKSISINKKKESKEKVEEGIGTTVAGALGNPPVLSKRMKLKRALLNREVQKNVQKNKEKKYSGKTTVNEAGDWWHPDPEKDKKLPGKGPQMRAREDRGQSTSAQTKPDYSKRLKPGESYMDFAKRKAAERSKK